MIKIFVDPLESGDSDNHIAIDLLDFICRPFVNYTIDRRKFGLSIRRKERKSFEHFMKAETWVEIPLVHRTEVCKIDFNAINNADFKCFGE